MFRPPIVAIFRVGFLKNILHGMSNSLQWNQQTQQKRFGLDGPNKYTKQKRVIQHK